MRDTSIRQVNPNFSRCTSDSKCILPSLISPQQEASIRLKQDFFIDEKYSLNKNVESIKKYRFSDDYNPIFLRLSPLDKYLLHFIGAFKSVQLLHLYRLLEIFPQLLDGENKTNQIIRSLNRLQKNGFIRKWNFKQEILNKTLYTFTLTGHGYMFLNTFYGNKYFNPNNFELRNDWHLRAWEAVDVYEFGASQKEYAGKFSIFFNGINNEGTSGTQIRTSLLQMAFTKENALNQNLVIYCALYKDTTQFYVDIVKQWKELTDLLGDNFSINDLDVGQNFLAIYVPTQEMAKNLITELSATISEAELIFIVGSLIRLKGFQDSMVKVDIKDNQATVSKYDF